MPPGPPPGSPYPPSSPGPSTEAIVAVVLSALTFFTSCFPLGLVGFFYGRKARRRGLETGNKADETMGLSP